MAIDASIYNRVQLPDFGRSLTNGLLAGARLSEQPMRNELLNSQVERSELSNDALRQQISEDEENFMLQDMATDAIQIKKLAQADPMQAQVALAQRIKKIQDRGGDPSDTVAARELLTQGRMDEFMAELDAPILAAQQRGLLGRGNSAIREFESKAAAAGLKPGTPEYERAARVDLGLDPRAVGSASQTIATTPGMTDTVAGSQEKIDNSKAYGSASGKGAAALDSLSDQWEANREFIVSAIPGIQDVLEESPGSSLGKAASTFLSKSVGGLDSVDAQAELEQFGAILLQGVPFAPGAQSDKELQARAKLVSDQLEDPNISPAKKIEILGRFIDFQDARASAQRRISESKRGKSGEKPMEQRSSVQPSSFTSSNGIQFTVE